MLSPEERIVAKTQESGLDELMRLSRQTAKMGDDLARKEQQKEAHSQKVQGVVQGLREISFSIAMQQLQTVADPEVVKKVEALSRKPGTEDLRKMVSTLSRDLERAIHKHSAANPELAGIEQSVKTLSILLGLLFSL